MGELVGEEERLEDGVIYFMLSFSSQKLEMTSLSLKKLVKINKKCLNTDIGPIKF